MDGLLIMIDKMMDYCIQVPDDGTDYDYSVQQDYGSISNYSTLRTATRYLLFVEIKSNFSLCPVIRAPG